MKRSARSNKAHKSIRKYGFRGNLNRRDPEQRELLRGYRQQAQTRRAVRVYRDQLDSLEQLAEVYQLSNNGR